MLTEPNPCYRSTINDTELDLANLAADVRSFVQQYRKGHRDTKRLISREALETRTHFSTTIEGTNEAIDKVSQSLGNLTVNMGFQVDQAKRERLLQSLKYPGFNERRNEVREAHTDTFQWVFAGDGEESAGSDSESDSEPDSEPGSEPGFELDFGSDSESQLESDPETNMVKWDSFSNWLKSTDTVYWISGKPGSGKSTLVKYILSDPQTQQCLDIWAPGCLLISHYFWRPGSPMQRSIKGLFCSLLFQLLENSETALGKVIQSASGSSTKRDVTDWSLEELKSTVLSTVEVYDRPVCVFLDGLDELYPEQPPNLLDIIRKLSAAGKTKMCLASRPEPPLQRRLYNMPQLRLQDLTAADLTRYVYDNIHASSFENLDRYEELAKSLVKRAEGVFLWLVLVTKSVRNGFDNGDSINIIEERIDRLKGGDLESLYNDMWDRASKDNPDAYRRTAALYFRIMLLYNHEENDHLQTYGENLSVFTMMLATTGFAEKTLEAAPQPVNLVPEEKLLQSCKEVERIAEIYCFGLLEISHQNNRDETKKMVGWYKGKYDKLLVYAQVQRALVFIHRTAVDFLVDTTQGQEILSYGNTTESSHAIRLVTANLAHAQLFCHCNGRCSSASSHLSSVDGVLRQAYTDAEESLTTDYRRMMMYYKRLCDFEKLFAYCDRRKSCVCSGPDFFKAVAMHSWRCLDILEDQIKALDKETLSEILHILCVTSGIRTWTFVIRFDVGVLRLINLLLLEGADPNWRGTTVFARSPTDPRPYMCRWTPFMAFLSRALDRGQLDDNLAVHGSDAEILMTNSSELSVTLQTFISCGADLDAMVAVSFRTSGVQPSTAGSRKTRQTLYYGSLRPGDFQFFEEHLAFENEYWYVCSFPAHNILTVVLSKWEPLRQLSNEEKPFADIRSSVAHYSTCSPRRRYQTVLRRFETIAAFDHGSQVWRWCMPPQEHQDQIGKELLSLIKFSGGSFENFQRTPSAGTQAFGYKTLESMLCGPHWAEMGSGTSESVVEHLVELGVFARDSNPREFHTVEEWLQLKGIFNKLE